MKHRLTNKTEQQSESEHQITNEQEGTVREFETVEDLLRFDAASTELPEQLRQRVMGTLATEPRSTPWWRGWWR